MTTINKSYEEIKLKVIAKVNRLMLNPSNKSNKISLLDVIDILKSVTHVVAEPVPNNRYSISILFKDYETGLYTNSSEYLSRLLIHVVDHTTYRTTQDLVRDVLTTMRTLPISEFDRYVKPKQGFIKLKNGYYDWFEHKFYTQKQFENSPAFGHYHFTQQVNYDLTKNPSHEMIEILDDVLNDWSGGNDDNKHFLVEVLQASITGNGHGRLIVFQSRGGDGKSTYLNICKNLATDENTLDMNVHDIADDGVLNQLTPNIKLIAGDESGTRATLSGKSLAKFKILTSGGSVQVSRKYLANILIQTQALWIQLTNSNISFLENSDAIKDRIIFYIWPNLNFRRHPKTSYNLKEIIKSTEFYESILWYLLTQTDLSNDFTVTESMIQQTHQLIESVDIVQQYADYLFDNGMLDNFKLPRKIAYLAFKSFEQMMTGKSTGMSEKTFGKRFAEILEKYGFEQDINLVTPSAISPIVFDKYNMWLTLVSESDIKKLGRQRTYINKNNQIDESLVTEIEQLLDDSMDVDLTNQTNIRILHYLAHKKLNPIAMSIVSEDL